MQHLRLLFLPWFALLFFATTLFGKEAGIAVFFGTFDPPHEGHQTLARLAADYLQVKRLFLIPNCDPRHKKEATPFFHRHAMTRLWAMRDRRFEVPPRELLEEFARGTEQEYPARVIDYLRQRFPREGPIYHLCGADSFNKMATYRKLPSPGEDRVVVVFNRAGYAIEKVPTARECEQRGQLIFLESAIREQSSSALRKALKSGSLSGAIPPYIRGYLRRHRLYDVPVARSWEPSPILTSGFHRADLMLAPPPSRPPFQRLPVTAFVASGAPRAPLTFDVDRYLEKKLPPLVVEILSRPRIRVTVLGSTLEQGLEFIGEAGYHRALVFSPPPHRPGFHYVYCPGENGGERLFVTAIFGQDKFNHLVHQFVFLLYRAGFPLGHLEVYQHRHYPELGPALFEQALEGVEEGHAGVVFIGYAGALAHLLPDIHTLIRSRGSEFFRQCEFSLFSTAFPPHSESGSLPALAAMEEGGRGIIPFKRVVLPAGGRSRFALLFRNLYGDQTEDCIRILFRRGYRKFVIFGNGGVLDPQLAIGEVIAPVLVAAPTAPTLFRNFAAREYPRVFTQTLPTIFQENEAWLEKAHTRFQAVEVEAAYVARCARDLPDARFYCGVLPGDRPGGQDITVADEDSLEMIEAKREFFFNALRRFVY